MDYCAPSYLAAKRIRSIVCMMIYSFFSGCCVNAGKASTIAQKKYPQYSSVTCCIRKDNEVSPIFFFLSHLVRKGDVPLFEYIVTSNTMGQFVCLMHESILFLKRDWWRLDLWFWIMQLVHEATLQVNISEISYSSWHSTCHPESSPRSWIAPFRMCAIASSLVYTPRKNNKQKKNIYK